MLVDNRRTNGGVILSGSKKEPFGSLPAALVAELLESIEVTNAALGDLRDRLEGDTHYGREYMRASVIRMIEDNEKVRAGFLDE